MNQSPNQGRRYSELNHVQERLVAVATNPRDVLIVRTPWRTGIRVSELIGIRTGGYQIGRQDIFGEGE